MRLNTDVRQILSDDVLLSGRHERRSTTIVIVQAGGELPTGLLRQLGVTVETKYGTA